jgi:hypothetical protein
VSGADYARIQDPDRREHYVYRLLNKRDQVIYIGCSMNLPLRLREHRLNGRFGHLWVRVSASGPYNYQTGRAKERAEITDLEPEFNTEWTKRHQRGVAIFRLKARA